MYYVMMHDSGSEAFLVQSPHIAVYEKAFDVMKHIEEKQDLVTMASRQKCTLGGNMSQLTNWEFAMLQNLVRLQFENENGNR